MAGSGGQGAQVGGKVGLQRAVRGPEQTRVAVAFRLAGDPADQVAEGIVRGQGRLRALLLPVGLQQPGDGVPVEGAVGAGGLEELVGVAADVGGRGQDVAAVGPEVQVVVGQVAVALAGAGESHEETPAEPGNERLTALTALTALPGSLLGPAAG